MNEATKKEGGMRKGNRNGEDKIRSLLEKRKEEEKLE